MKALPMTVLAAQKTDLRRIGAHRITGIRWPGRSDLKRGKTLACRFAGGRWCSIAAKAATVPCAGRSLRAPQVPLSMGIVEGEELKCGYHGWTYDCAGQCVNIPYLGASGCPMASPPIPPREVGRNILVFPGEPSLAETGCRSLGFTREPGYKTRPGIAASPVTYSFMHENLFDMNHQSLHRSLMGSIKATCLGRRGRATIGRSGLHLQPGPEGPARWERPPYWA